MGPCVSPRSGCVMEILIVLMEQMRIRIPLITIARIHRSAEKMNLSAVMAVALARTGNVTLIMIVEMDQMKVKNAILSIVNAMMMSLGVTMPSASGRPMSVMEKMIVVIILMRQ